MRTSINLATKRTYNPVLEHLFSTCAQMGHFYVTEGSPMYHIDTFMNYDIFFNLFYSQKTDWHLFSSGRRGPNGLPWDKCTDQDQNTLQLNIEFILWMMVENWRKKSMKEGRTCIKRSIIQKIDFTLREPVFMSRSAAKIGSEVRLR